MNDIDFSNENYLKEMERNTRLFEEKMNKLEEMRSKNYSSNNNKQKLQKKQMKSCSKFYSNKLNDNDDDINTNINSNPSKLNNRNSTLSNQIKNIKIYTQNNANNFNDNFINNINDEEDNYNYLNNNTIKRNEEKKKLSFQNDKNKTNKIDMENKKKIEQLKSECMEKDIMIKKLEKELKEKEKLPSQKQYDDISNDYEKIKLELEDKIKIIKRLEGENKDLKMKIDNIIEQNKNMKEVIKKKNDEIENKVCSMKFEFFILKMG